MCVSISNTGFPYSVEFDSETEVITWSNVVNCLPDLSNTTVFKLHAALPGSDDTVLPSITTPKSSVQLAELFNRTNRPPRGHVYVSLLNEIGMYLYTVHGHKYSWTSS